MNSISRPLFQNPYIPVILWILGGFLALDVLCFPLPVLIFVLRDLSEELSDPKWGLSERISMSRVMKIKKSLGILPCQLRELYLVHDASHIFFDLSSRQHIDVSSVDQDFHVPQAVPVV
jgi:hypothetical protein